MIQRRKNNTAMMSLQVSRTIKDAADLYLSDLKMSQSAWLRSLILAAVPQVYRDEALKIARSKRQAN